MGSRRGAQSPDVDSVAAAEFGQPLGTRGRLAQRLADDPRVDPTRVLDRDRRPERAVVDRDPGAVPIVGHPVRLELERDVGDDRDREQPVEIGRVEPVDDIGQSDGRAPLEAGQQVDDPDGRERVAGLRDDRRREDRIGQPGGCRTQRTEADGRARDVRHGVLTGSVISDWFTRDCRVYRTAADRSRPNARTSVHANEPSPSRYRIPTETRHAATYRAKRPGTACAVRPVRASTRSELDAHDGPRTDPGRTDHRPRATGRDLPRDRPLPGLGVTGGRSWTRLEGPSCGHRTRARVDVQRRDRGRRSGVVRFERRRDDDPDPHLRLHQLRPHQGGLGHPPHQVRGRRHARRQGAHLRRHQRHDRSRRRYRPHLVHDPRAADRALERPVRQVRRDRRPGRCREGRPAAHRRRVQGQPGREGRPGRR